MKTAKELLEEIQSLEARLEEIGKKVAELIKEEEQVEVILAEERGKITMAEANIKVALRRKRRLRKEKRELENEASGIRRSLTLKKKKLEKMKKELLESLKSKKDFSTEKYGPDYLADLASITLENGNGKE